MFMKENRKNGKLIYKKFEQFNNKAPHKYIYTRIYVLSQDC